MGSAFSAIFAEVLMVAVIAVCTLPGATALMRTPFAAQEEEIRLTHLAKAYARLNIVMQIHYSVMRNNNARIVKVMGADAGVDCISPNACAPQIAKFLSDLDEVGMCPRTILYSLTPADNAQLGTLIGCFQSSEARGKLQYGAAWWFLDNKVGMERHLEDLTATGHLATFVGMLTDSRSLLSYPRHHYFRRILCNYLGTMMERGEMTDDIEAVGEVVRDICYRNAARYFGLQ